MRSHGVSGGKETVGSTSSSLPVSHAVVLFFVTAGQNGENLGSDEEQIVLAVYQLYDIKNNKVKIYQVEFNHVAIYNRLRELLFMIKNNVPMYFLADVCQYA